MLVALAASPACASGLVLKNANIVDPSNRTISKHDVYIRDGKIATANTASDDSKIVDLSGKWVIPGLIDLHVHCHGNPLANGEYEELGAHKSAKIMLYCGVCAFLDLAARNYETLFAARDEQRANAEKFSDEADIYCAGGPFGRWNLPSPAQAPNAIDEYIEKWHPDVVKLIYGRDTLDCATLTAAVKTARQAGVKTVVHIGSWQHARDSIKAGATAVTHFFDDEVIPRDIVRVWRKNNTVSIPTMAVQCDMANFVEKPQLLDSPLLTAIEPAASLQTYRDREHFSKKANFTVKWQTEDMDNDFQSFRKLAAARVPMLAGSDTGNLGTFQGFSLHREIKLMQDAGYSSWDALAAATIYAADFLGRTSGIKTGDTAELVILDADPIADIANTQKIFGVVHHSTLIQSFLIGR